MSNSGSPLTTNRNDTLEQSLKPPAGGNERARSGWELGSDIRLVSQAVSEQGAATKRSFQISPK